MANVVHSPESPAVAASSLAAAQTRYKYTIPEAVRSFATDPREVVLKELSVAEESRVSKIAQNKGGEFAYEALKAAVVEVDGSPLTWDNGAKDIFIDGLSPRVRTLLLEAYKRLHIPQDEDLDSFFKSQTTIL